MSSPEMIAASLRRPPVRAAVWLVGAVAAVAAGVRGGLHVEALLAAAFVVTLAAISATDIETRRIPNVLVVPATAVALLAQGLLHPGRFLECVLAGVGAAGFFFVANLVSNRAVGMGDVKLALLLGVVLGSSVLGALFLGSVVAATVGLVLIARNGFGARKSALPFAPFLALGAVAALLAGSPPIYP